jgi:hypothetical protein
MLLAKEAPEMEGLFFILNQLPELMWLRLTCRTQARGLVNKLEVQLEPRHALVQTTSY